MLVRGSLVAYAVLYPTGERRLALEVGEIRWWLLTNTASLKVAPSTYMMSLPGGQTFYSITFAAESPPEVCPLAARCFDETRFGQHHLARRSATRAHMRLVLTGYLFIEKLSCITRRITILYHLPNLRWPPYRVTWITFDNAACRAN